MTMVKVDGTWKKKKKKKKKFKKRKKRGENKRILLTEKNPRDYDWRISIFLLQLIAFIRAESVKSWLTAKTSQVSADLRKEIS